MRHQDATTWILCAHKQQGNSSHELYKAMRRAGVNVYRVTAGTNPKYSPSRVNTIINWGVSRTPIWFDRLPDDVRWYNTSDTVLNSSHKIRMQEKLGYLGLDYTEHKSTAARWVDEGETVVTRTRLSASQGRGIVLSPIDPLPDADLYTKLISKPEDGSIREYRVYIFGGKAFDLTEKRRMNRERREQMGIDGRDPYTRLIRAHRNGWVFARNTTQATEHQKEVIKRVAEEAAARMNLGCGGIDLITPYDSAGELMEIRVVETNSQVGINGEPQQADRFVAAYKEAVAA